MKIGAIASLTIAMATFAPLAARAETSVAFANSFIGNHYSAAVLMLCDAAECRGVNEVYGGYLQNINGRYTNSNSILSPNSVFAVGYSNTNGNHAELNNYVILNGITSPVLSASLLIYAPQDTFQSDFSSSTYTMWDVDNLNVQALFSTNWQNSTDPVAATVLNDLHSGVSLGSGSVSTANYGGYVRVDFNSAGLAAINAAAGGSGGFVIGGSLSQASPPVAPPVGALVPEPATWSMMLLGFGGLGALLRRRQRLVRPCSSPFGSSSAA